MGIVTWQAGDSTDDWNDPAAWSGGTVPGQADVASFADATATVFNDATVGTISLDDAQITLLDGFIQTDPNSPSLVDQSTGLDASGGGAAYNTLTVDQTSFLDCGLISVGDTDLSDQGGLVAIGGDAQSLEVSGSGGFAAFAGTLSTTALTVTDGASVTGDILLVNQGNLTFDDLSSLSQGTIETQGKVFLNLVPSQAGSASIMALGDGLLLDANSDLIVSASSKCTLAIAGAIVGSGTLQLGGTPLVLEAGASIDTAILETGEGSVGGVGGGGGVGSPGTITVMAGSTFDSGVLSIPETTISDSGLFEASGGTLQSLSVSGIDAIASVSGTLAVSTLTVSSGGSFTGSVRLSDGSVLALDSSAEFTDGIIEITGNASLSVLPSAGVGTPTAVLDDGLYLDGVGSTLTVAGGTLSLGTISGDGTLLIGQGVTLSLDGAAGSGVIIDFTANGTLSASVTPAAAIAGFGASDAILLPFTDATAATYAATGPRTGLLTITGESQVLGVLTLLGMNAGSQFFVTGSASGRTLLTTIPPGGQYVDTDNFIASEPSYAQQALDEALAGLPTWVFVSPDGSFTGAVPESGYANVALASNPAVSTSLITLPYGYKVLIANGDAAVNLVDWSVGNSLIIGNAGNDSITSTAQNDTMIGAAGANTVFWATGAANMVGGGNDVFVSGSGDADITTSHNGTSICWLGGANNLVTLNGTDTVACNGSNENPTAIANDTVFALGGAGDGCLVVGPDLGQMAYHCGAGPSSIVGQGGTLVAYGAGGQNLLIGGTTTNSFLEYIGGAGGALIVGEAGTMYIQGGPGAVTVFGGTGEGNYSAEAGNSYFVVGDGPSTVSASSGNTEWLLGSADVQTNITGGGVIAWGANSSGNNVFQAGSGPVTIAGGMGSDLFEAGSGNATLEGGSGVETFSFTNGQAGGQDVLTNFAKGRDLIGLAGYAETPAAILAAETVSGGNTTLVLSDGTHILLAGVTGLTAASFTT